MCTMYTFLTNNNSRNEKRSQDLFLQQQYSTGKGVALLEVDVFVLSPKVELLLTPSTRAEIETPATNVQIR